MKKKYFLLIALLSFGSIIYGQNVTLTTSKTTITESENFTVTATLDVAQAKDVVVDFASAGIAKYSLDFTSNSEIRISTVAGGNGNGSAQNQLNYPSGVFVDDLGNVYVADGGNNRIQKWAPGATEGETVISGVSRPSDVFVDTSGNIYVVEVGEHQVTKWFPGATSGEIVAGGNGKGNNANQLWFPQDLFVDTSGNIYVSDSGSQRIQKWAPNATEGITVAGGNDGGSAQNQLNAPRGIFVDDLNNIYVADFSNNRIQKWKPGATEGETVISSVSQPLDVFVDEAGNIYVLVVESPKNQVTKWIPGSTSGEVVAGGNGIGSNANQFNVPQAMFVDETGNIYVADGDNHRVQKYDITPQLVIKASETTAQLIFSGIEDLIDENDETIVLNTTASNAVLVNADPIAVNLTDITEPPTVAFTFSKEKITENSLTDVTLSAKLSSVSGKEITIPFTISGTATINDEFTVDKTVITIPANESSGIVTISTKGLDDATVEILETIVFEFGTLTNATTATNSVTLNLESDDNPALTLTTSKTTITESENFTVTAKIDAPTSKAVLVDFASAGIAKYNTDFASNVALKIKTVAGGNGSGSAQNQLHNPLGGVFVDDLENVYVADYSNNRIQKWASGATEGETIISGVSRPAGVLVDATGSIYIVEQNKHQVTKWISGATSGVIVAGGNASGNNANQLRNPNDLFVDTAGNIYVSDKDNHRIQKWSPNATEGITVAGGNGSGIAQNQLDTPSAVFVDEFDNVYTADRSNGPIKKWKPGATEGETVITVAGSANPAGLFVDTSGNIYVSELDKHQVTKWIPGATSGEVVAGGGGKGSNANQLHSPTALFVDKTGNIYVTDNNNHRIQKYDISPQLVIKAGETAGELLFSGIEDIIDENDETIVLNTTASNAVLASADPIALTLTDINEPPTVAFTFSKEKITENSLTDVTLTATLLTVSAKDVTIDFTMEGSAVETTDYVVSGKSISILANSPSGKITISTKDLDDALVEVLDSIVFRVATITNATALKDRATLFLESDDDPIVKNIVANKTEFAEHESAEVTATLDFASSREITIPITVAGTATLNKDYSTSYTGNGKEEELLSNLPNNHSRFGILDNGDYVFFNNKVLVVVNHETKVSKTITPSVDGYYMQVLGNSAYIQNYDKIIKVDLSDLDNVQISTIVTPETPFRFAGTMYVDADNLIYASKDGADYILYQKVKDNEPVIISDISKSYTVSNFMYFMYNDKIYAFAGKRIIELKDKTHQPAKFFNDIKFNRIKIINGVPYALVTNTTNNNESQINILNIDNATSKKVDYVVGDDFGSIRDFFFDVKENLFLFNTLKDNTRGLFKYQLFPQIIIPAGEKEGKLKINGIEDNLNFEGEETDETIMLTYQDPINAIKAAEVITTELTILNNKYDLELQNSPFIGLSDSSVSWGDFDRDGDQDVAVIGRSNLFGIITRLYRNDAGTFVDTEYSFKNVYDGDIEWADLNKDGYIDLIVSGLDSNNESTTTIYLNTDGTEFNESTTLNLPGLFGTSISSGDLDNDGDIDFSLLGLNSQNQWIFEIYYRKDNTFVKEIDFNGASLQFGKVIIADYDLDGDQDILGIGNNSSYYKENTNINNTSTTANNLPRLSKSSMAVYGNIIYMMGENSNKELGFWFGTIKSFRKASNIDGLKNGDIAVGDYNNDGNIDLVVTGENTLGESISKLYDGIQNNNSPGSTSSTPFELNTEIDLKGFRNSTANWVDYDVDGDLDLFLSGTSKDGEETILYKTNLLNKSNNAPNEITDLTFDNLGNGKVKLSWTAPKDDFSKDLGYIIRLGTSPGGTELANTESNLITGQRLITKSPAIYSTSYELALNPGNYYWSVQSVDKGYKGSKFSKEQTFQLTYEWKLLNQGGIIDRTIPGVSDAILKLSDLDNDNDLDLIYSSRTSSGNLKTYSLDKNQYKLTKNLGLNSITDIVFLDLNNDNIQDIIVNNYNNSNSNGLRVYLSGKNGNFSSNTISLGLFKAKLKVVDINNDGKNEIAQIGLTSSFNNATLKVNIFEQENNSLKTSSIDISNQVTSLTAGGFDFGDIDGDQDFDFAITGFSSSGLNNKIYLNETKYDDFIIAPLLTESELKTISARESTLDFIDFDSDGDLDIAITGTSVTGDVFQIYENKVVDDKIEFILITTGLLPIRNANIELGDFNGDGYADILYSGTVSGQGQITKLAEYNPQTKSFDESSFDLGAIINASVAFGDIDGDGDLDFAISGEDSSNNNAIVFRTYANVRNESAAVSSLSGKSSVNKFTKNDRPTPPKNLTNYNIGYDAKTKTYQTVFEWTASSDDNTPSPGLTYALKVGTTEGGNEIMKVNSLNNGFRKIAGKGNVEHNLKWKLNLPIGKYYWSVHAIDASYSGSEFSEIKEMNISTLKVDEEEINYLKIYPTLIENYFEINNFKNIPINRVTLYNIYGQKIKSFKKGLSKPLLRIKTNELSIGVYIVEIISGNMKITKKLIKK